MNVPQQASPVIRAAFSRQPAGDSGVYPARGCGGVPKNILGKCALKDGDVLNRVNCAACCNQRLAQAWSGGGFVVEC